MDAATIGGPVRVPAGGVVRQQAATFVVVGALLGLAWASSLRGWMMQLVGSESAVTWSGTFVGVLLPGVVVGALLGWAEHRRRMGGRRGWLVPGWAVRAVPADRRPRAARARPRLTMFTRPWAAR